MTFQGKQFGWMGLQAHMSCGIVMLTGVLLLFAGACSQGGTQETQAGASEKGPSLTVWSVEPDGSGRSAQVRDMLGRQVQVPWPVERVVGLRAGALRMLVYLQVTDRVIAIEEPERRSDRPYILANPDVAGLPAIGPQMGGDVEQLIAARPQVLFLTFTNVAQADELQARTGIPVIALEYGDFADNREQFFSSLSLMGSLMGASERARELDIYTTQTLAELERRTAGVAQQERPRVYIGGIAYRGARGIASTEPAYPPLAFVNAFNVASTLDQRLVHPVQGTTVDVEQLIDWDPEAIFIDVFSRHLVRRDLAEGSPLAHTLSAVRNGRLYGMLPYNNYATNYETLLANAWAAGKALYPERFDDISVHQRADEVFRMFLGQPIYDQMAARHAGYGAIDLFNAHP